MTPAVGPYEILTALAPMCKSYLCVGVQEGICLSHVLRANPDINRLMLCDTWGPHHGGTNRGSHEHIQSLLDGLGFAGIVEFLDGSSQELLPGVSRCFDLTYVDGDHSEEAAYADLVNVWRLTTRAMVVHDTQMPEVAAALERFWGSEHCGTPLEALAHPGTLVVFR